MFGRSSAHGAGERARRGRTRFDSASDAQAGARASFSAGDRVSHKTFGTGVITKVDGDTIFVKFSKTGQVKKLLKDYAPIVKMG